MPLDPYENFRLKIDDDYRRALEEAAEKRDELRPDPSRAGYFLDRNDTPVLDPVVQCHISIAESRAERQVPANLPEDEVSCLRYPGIDPGGKYSSIDMRFAQRLADIKARSQFCSEASRDAYLHLYENLMLPPDKDMFNPIDDEQTGYRYPLYLAMRQACKEHRLCSRAAKLTPDITARQFLETRQRDLEADPRVVQFDLMIQGLEYLVGIRPGPVANDVMDFYREIAKDQLLRPELVERASDRAVPAHVEMNFQDSGNRTVQMALADPNNWGKSWETVREERRNSPNQDRFQVEIDGLVSPYAAATAKRVLDPAFDDTEHSRGDIFDRTDLITIDGKTVRELMQETFTASGRGDSFSDFYREHRLQMTNELVAAGLMAGKRVEAFIPDRNGRLPDEPTQLVRTGYEPTPAQPEQFNAWQRFFSKRGFYKEKVARQAEYERTMAARERVRRLALLKGLPARTRQYSTAEQKDLFFRPAMNQLGLVKANGERDENGLLPPDWDQATAYMHRLGAQGAYERIARSEAVDTCVLYLALKEHYPFQDIMDPEKLQEEREAAVQLFMEKARANDQAWLGRVFYHGQKELLRQARELARGVDPQNEAQLLTVLPVLQSIATVCFSVTQQTREDLGSRVPYMMEGVLETADRDLVEGCKRVNALEAEINNFAAFFKELDLGLTVQSKLANAAAAPEELELTNHEVTSLATQRILSGGVAAGQSLMDQIPDAHYTVNLRGDIQYESIESVRHYLNRPKNRDYARHLAATGEIDGVLTFSDRTSPALNGRGEPLVEQDTVYTLEDRNGKMVSASVRVPTGRQATRHDIQLGLDLPPERHEANLADLRWDEITRRVERLNALAARSQSSADRNRELFFAPVMEEKGLVHVRPDGTRTYDWDGLQREMMDHGAKGAYLGTTRTELTSACICLMAVQGHSFKEIMNPNQLREERLAAARLLLAKGEANDQEFLGRLFYRGQKALVREFDNVARDLDMQNDDRMMRVLPDLQAISGACFSVSQMLSADGCRLSYIREAIADAGGVEAQGVQKAQELDSLVGNLNNFSEQAVRAYQIQARMASSTAAPDAELLTDRDMGFLFMYNVLTDQVKGDGPLSQRIPVYREAIKMESDITRSSSAEQIRMYLNHPQNRDRAKELAGSGELTKALSVRCASAPAKDRYGREIMQSDTVYTLEKNRQTGQVTVGQRREDVAVKDYGYRFTLELPGLTQQELQTKAAEQQELRKQAILREAAQQQAAQAARQQTPQQQTPQRQEPQRQEPRRQPPQRGGLGL